MAHALVGSAAVPPSTLKAAQAIPLSDKTCNVPMVFR